MKHNRTYEDKDKQKHSLEILEMKLLFNCSTSEVDYDAQLQALLNVYMRITKMVYDEIN
jgi:hypothetical protein